MQKAKENEGVVLVPYKAEWNKWFLKEKKIIQTEIGGYIWDIEHTGSTSIPEMSSAPIIDILIGIEDLSAIGDFENTLNDMGYARTGISYYPGHLLFVCGSAEPFHLHFAQERSLRDTPHQKFREALLKDAKQAKAYKELKIKLVKSFKADPKKYAREKEKWIRALLIGAK